MYPPKSVAKRRLTRKITEHLKEVAAQYHRRYTRSTVWPTAQADRCLHECKPFCKPRLLPGRRLKAAIPPRVSALAASALRHAEQQPAFTFPPGQLSPKLRLLWCNSPLLDGHQPTFCSDKNVMVLWSERVHLDQNGSTRRFGNRAKTQLA